MSSTGKKEIRQHKNVVFEINLFCVYKIPFERQLSFKFWFCSEEMFSKQKRREKQDAIAAGLEIFSLSNWRRHNVFCADTVQTDNAFHRISIALLSLSTYHRKKKTKNKNVHQNDIYILAVKDILPISANIAHIYHSLTKLSRTWTHNHSAFVNSNLPLLVQIPRDEEDFLHGLVAVSGWKRERLGGWAKLSVTITKGNKWLSKHKRRKNRMLS